MFLLLQFKTNQLLIFRNVLYPFLFAIYSLKFAYHLFSLINIFKKKEEFTKLLENFKRNINF